MRPMSAYTASGLISGGTVPEPARASISLLSHHLDSADGAIFGVVSPSWPRVRRNINAPGPRASATVSKQSGFPISAVILGGIIATSVAVALSLLLLFCLWHRGRKRRRKKAGDLENGRFLLASHDIGSTGSSSANHSKDSPRSNLNDAPLITQPSSKAAVPLSLPTLPISQVSGGNNGRARSLPHHPPLPPPPVLHLERGARRGNSFPVARPRTTGPIESSNRVSVIPNPWDSGAKPSAAPFERGIFGLPPSALAVRPANPFRAGLPRTPRERQTFLPPESRPQFTVAVNRT